MTSSSISSYVVVFLLSGLINGPSFIMISFLVLELWQFLFIRDWPEIRKSERPLSEFCPIPGEWCKLPYAAKCQVYSFYCFWVIKGKPTGGGIKKLPPPTRLGLTYVNLRCSKASEAAMWRCSGEKDILKIFAKITGTNLHRSLSLIKLDVAGM